METSHGRLNIRDLPGYDGPHALPRPTEPAVQRRRRLLGWLPWRGAPSPAAAAGASTAPASDSVTGALNADQFVKYVRQVSCVTSTHAALYRMLVHPCIRCVRAFVALVGWLLGWLVRSSLVRVSEPCCCCCQHLNMAAHLFPFKAIRPAVSKAGQSRRCPVRHGRPCEPYCRRANSHAHTRGQGAWAASACQCQAIHTA